MKKRDKSPVKFGDIMSKTGDSSSTSGILVHVLSRNLLRSYGIIKKKMNIVTLLASSPFLSVKPFLDVYRSMCFLFKTTLG